MALKIVTLAFVLFASTSGWAKSDTGGSTCSLMSGKSLFAKSAATTSSSSKSGSQKGE